jgi:hypothetical protein
MAKRAKPIPALKVVFDTNALFTEAAHFLVSKDVRDLVGSNSGHQDVKISWHLPEIVAFERTYQMREKALSLLPQIERVEKLLKHNLNITEQLLCSQVDQRVRDEAATLGFEISKLDPSKVDWPEVWRRAAFRLPPFDAKKEGNRAR